MLTCSPEAVARTGEAAWFRRVILAMYLPKTLSLFRFECKP